MLNLSLRALSRVYGCQGDTVDDIIIAALLEAYHDRHDVMSMSLGDPTTGWSEGAVGVIASRIAATGVVVTAASGKNYLFPFSTISLTVSSGHARQ